jgi:hypothetical protein
MAITVTPQQQSQLSRAPISKIKLGLDRLFGKNIWATWEPETISLEFGIEFEPLLLDKIAVLQVLVNQPNMFYVDPIFMLHATEVINNEVADFDILPVPTSLELGYAITQVSEVTGVLPTSDNPIATTAAYMLRQEGYSEPIIPFQFVPVEQLEKGQTKADTEAKKEAMAKYIKHMESE